MSSKTKILDGKTPFVPNYLLAHICISNNSRVFVAGVAQLVEHHLAKVDVEGSNPFARSNLPAFGKKIGYLVSQAGYANGQIFVRRIAEIDCFASCAGYNG